MHNRIGSLYLAQLFKPARIARLRQTHRVKTLLAAVVLCLVSGLALAQSNDRWISDQFEVTLRTGKSTEQSIIKLLPSGTRVTVLEQDVESGYTKVRTQDGTEGWLLTRYLISSPTTRQQIPALQTQLRNSEETKLQLQARIAELEKEQRNLQTQITRAETSSRGLQQQLDDIRKVSSETIQLHDQNKQLKQKLSDDERRIDELESENRKLSIKTTREWFIVGAGVLFFGLILGLIIPRMSGQRKSRIVLPP